MVSSAMIADQAAESRNWELLRMRLQFKEGRLLKISGNKPVMLDDPDRIWVISNGSVDVFSSEMKEGQPASARAHLFSMGQGSALFGVPKGHTIALLVAGVPGTELLTFRRSAFNKLLADPEFAELMIPLLDGWVEALTSSVLPDLPPKDYTALSLEHETPLKVGEIARTGGEVLWVHHTAGKSSLETHTDFTIGVDSAAFPVSAKNWLTAVEDSSVTAVTTKAMISQESGWQAVDAFHSLLMDCIVANVTQQRAAEHTRLGNRSGDESRQVEDAFEELAAILEPPPAELMPESSAADPLFSSCQIIGQNMGIKVVQPPKRTKARRFPLQDIATASRFRARTIALRGQWWKDDNGPLLVTRIDGEERRPVALIPTGPNSYEVHDPAKRTKYPLTPDVAENIDFFGFQFYRPFPDRVLTAMDLVRFGARGHSRDLVRILAMGVLAGILGTVVPMLTGFIFDTVIPGARRSDILLIGLVMIVSAGATALFEITRNIAMLRIEGKMGTSLQAAIMDRVLDLPATFFRSFSTGDLGMRTMGIDIIRRALSGAVVASVLMSVSSLFSFGLLFVYSTQLGLIALGLIVFLAAVTLFTGFVQVRYQRQVSEVEGKISGIVLQFITGIAKFRVAGAEKRAFAYWAKNFAIQRRLNFKTSNVTNLLSMFNAAFPVITSMVIFYVITSTTTAGSGALSTGAFLAFTAAFAQVSAAVLALSSAFIVILSVVPIYERSKPILETLPEVSDSKADPGELRGEIEISHVTFRYVPDGPVTLNNVSIHIKPGQFVALVGPSGSGKSTILRLLLGFESPESGTILYDGQDLAGLDVRGVRRQIGTVLQNGKLMAGDIYRNIVGSSTMTVDDAWAAARMAGFEDDVKSMPMGMHTMVSEGGGTLSGGQRQRLLIARAIVTRPRIIFFDEATSALDNRTQEIVSKSLEGLEATRVVIAHRLSTIINADMIYVLQGGNLVQSGTYSQLIKQKGLFAELAKRQMA